MNLREYFYGGPPKEQKPRLLSEAELEAIWAEATDRARWLAKPGIKKRIVNTIVRVWGYQTVRQVQSNQVGRFIQLIQGWNEDFGKHPDVKDF